MRFGSILFMLSLALLISVPVHAVTYGQLQGKIDFTDGLAVAVTPFTIITGSEARKMKCDAQGEFSAVLPTGKAIIKFSTFQQSVQITEGEVTEVKLTVPRPGWVVRCVDAQGNQLAVQHSTARYSLSSVKKSAVAWKTSDGVRNAEGIIWFADIPTNIRKLQVLYSYLENGIEKTDHQQWDFSSPPTSHQLTATDAPRAQCWLFIEDGSGNRLTNTAITGNITFWQQNDGFAIFDNPAKARLTSQQYPLSDLQTDGRGAIFLGCWPAGKYVVTLQAGERSGLPTTYMLQANGAVGDGSTAGKTYLAKLLTRTVKQTVYSTNEKVVPHALVNATYCYKQRAIYLQQQADENGVVCWRDLPPVPVITWGNGLAAAVIPAEGADFRQPLPAPQQQNNQATLIFTSTSDYQGEKIIGSVAGYDAYIDFSDKNITLDEGIANLLDYDELAIGTGNASGGTTLSLQAMVLSSPPCYFELSNCYIPYTTGQQTVLFRCDFSQFIKVHVKVQLPDGTPVTAVSKLGITAENSLQGPLPAIINMLNNNHCNYPEQCDNIYSILNPTLAADGTFSSCLPKAGEYRLNIDLFDESTPVAQALLFQVSPRGEDEITLTLPAPLFQLSAGTEVNWVTRHAPTTVRSLLVSALADSMPIFAPRGDVLACWARPSANRLRIWDVVTGIERESTLQLRNISLQISNNKNIYREEMQIELQPLLLPGKIAGLPMEYNPEYAKKELLKRMGTADPQQLIILPPGKTVGQYNLWSGRYLLGYSQSQCEVTIPAEGSARVSVKLPAPQQEQNISQAATKYYRLLLPEIDKKLLGKRVIAAAANYLTDGTPDSTQSVESLQMGENWVTLPADATTISIQWPGWGIIRDYPLNKSVMLNETPTLKPTEWTSGISIAGKIFDRRGNPYKNSRLSLSLQINSYSYYSFTSDQDGKFSISGLLPNQQIILRDNQAGWILTLPDKNVADVILHREDSPIRINFDSENSPTWLDYDMEYPNSQFWWFPENGEAQQLFANRENNSVYNLTLGLGWLWQTDNSRGEGIYQYCNLQPGNNDIEFQPTHTSLGIYFPYDTGQPLPGGVTVTGLEERSGISASYPAIKWVKSAQLGLLAGQISALPPGKYQISVQTMNGVVESPVTIGEYGAELHLQFPAEDNSPSPASAEEAEKRNLQQMEEHMIQLRDAIQHYSRH